jgi:protein-S-isoprenylcysteine O-methyltransferase Ste14
MNTCFHSISFVIGLMMFKLVINSGRNTGRLLTRLDIEADSPWMEANKLVNKGYYEYMRNSMHFGRLLFPWAIAFIIGSLSFVLIIAPLEMLIIVLMVKLVEEPQAVRKFGNEYLRYLEKVPVFSLRPDCLTALFGKIEPEKFRNG